MKHPADAIWLVFLGFGLGADIPLIKSGHQSVSQRAGASLPRKLLVTYFFVHFTGWAPKWVRSLDPLSRIATKLR